MRMTNRLILVAVMIVAAASMAHAAGKSDDWSGFYVGLNAGTARHAANWSDVDYDWYGGTLTNPYNATLYGLTVGWNRQSGAAVYGIELDYSAASGDNKVNYDSDGEGGFYVVKTDKLKSFSTLRGRAGWTVNSNALFYFTAGIAMPKAEHTWTEVNDVPDSWPTFTNDKVCLTYGLGFEHKIGTRLSWKLEYLAAKNAEKTSTNANGYRMQVDDNLDVFRAGVNFKF